MDKISNLFAMGIRTLTVEEQELVDLGPLAGLQGTWEADPFQGWNVIAVPGPQNTQGFTLEVIPYKEKLTFTPVVVAGNRGPFVNGVQQDQNLVGLMYEQTIVSVCNSDFCVQRGFKSGTEIHAERGIFLFDKSNLEPPFTITRLSTIPHGNALLALGEFFVFVPVNNDFIDKASTKPTMVSGGPTPLGYSEIQYDHAQFPDFDQIDPNSFLRKTLGDSVITTMTTLKLSTKHASGGVLNIPFIQQNVNTTSLDATFWIEKIKNPVSGQPDLDQLQYTQTINLVFPPTGQTTPVVWPHITIATLKKTAE